ncbi:MAG TPA: MFS transporter [Candidatus Atribacteria bacterium]|nr:MFS transporter [Candidatus Atribacteria bacterium]
MPCNHRWFFLGNWSIPFFRIMPIYVSKLGGTSFHAGIITSTLTITGLIALNLGGILSHYLSPKIIIITGWMFSSLAALTYLNIPTISGVLLGAILEGLAFVEMPPRVHVFSCLYPKNTHKALYTFIGGLSLGFLIGPPIGGLMAQYIGYKSIFITYAILAAIATLIIGTAIPYIPSLKNNYTKRANYIHVTRKIIWPIAITGIIAMGSGSVNVVISLYLKDTLHIKEAFIGGLSALSPLASMTLPLLAHMGLNPVNILKLMGIGLTIASSMILTPSIFSAMLFYFTSGWSGGLHSALKV